MRSPEAFAKSFKCPARLYYGSEEDWLQEETYRTALTAQNAGHQVQSQMIPGDHFTSVRPAMQFSIGFFRQIGLASGKQPPVGRAAGLRVLPPNILSPDASIPKPPVPSQPTPDELVPRIPRRRAPDDGHATGRVPRPNLPGGPDSSVPDFPRPSIPTPSRRSFPTPTRSPVPSARHQGILTFEVIGYSGRSRQMFAARRALIRSRWADSFRLEIDEEAGTISVPVRKNLEMNTETAKEALEKVGFEIGTITFKPIGAEDESKAAEDSEDIETGQ